MKKSPAPALTIGLELMELIAEQREIGFNDLMEQLGLNVTSLNRYLKALLEKGYICKSKSGKYTLGLKALLLSKNSKRDEALVFHAGTVIRDITKQYRVTTILVGYSGTKMIALDKEVFPDNVALQQVGSVRMDYAYNPWGHILLSHVTDSQQKFMLKNMDSQDIYNIHIPSEEEIAAFIEQTKSRGYADDQGRIYPQIIRIAFPIYGDGQLVAALAVGSIKGLLTEQEFKGLIEYMKEKAEELSGLVSNYYKTP